MYRRILLDTNAEMKEAVLLYLKCGFKELLLIASMRMTTRFLWNIFYKG
jgi:hypothetical protein